MIATRHLLLLWRIPFAKRDKGHIQKSVQIIAFPRACDARGKRASERVAERREQQRLARRENKEEKEEAKKTRTRTHTLSHPYRPIRSAVCSQTPHSDLALSLKATKTRWSGAHQTERSDPRVTATISHCDATGRTSTSETGCSGALRTTTTSSSRNCRPRQLRQ